MPLMQPNSIKKSYSKYKDIISFNKNIIIAAIITAIADVFIVNYAFMLILQIIYLSQLFL
jgi:hypothetical protein